jgi:rod shape-determining protein MreC
MIKFLSTLWDSYKEYILLIFIVIVSFILLSQSNNPRVQKVRAVAFSSFAVVTSVFYDLFNTTQIKKENEELRRVNSELMIQISMLREQGILNHELKGMAGFKDSAALPLVPASIVSKSLSQTQNTVTLSAGSGSGLKPGMPVLNHQGLVGIIQSTSEDFAIARTLRNVNLKISVKNERSRINGIMKWDGEGLVIIDVPKTQDFEVGDRIVTSEISSLVPVPVPVGVVTEIIATETGILNNVKIEPFADVQSIEHVFVLQIVQSVQKKNLELNFYKNQ